MSVLKNYTNRELEYKALTVIEKYKLIFLREVFVYVDYSEALFRKRGLHRSKRVIDALTKNKVNMKGALRKKWYDSENATLSIALYKLLADEEEHARLNNSFQTNTQVNHYNINFADLTKEQLEYIIEKGELPAELASRCGG